MDTEEQLFTKLARAPWEEAQGCVEFNSRLIKKKGLNFVAEMNKLLSTLGWTYRDYVLEYHNRY